MRLLHLVCLSVCAISLVSGANILAVFPAMSTSHYVVFEGFLINLARIGHNIKIITTFPQKETIDNLTEVNVKPMMFAATTNDSIEKFPSVPGGFLKTIGINFNYLPNTEKILNSSDVLNLITSKETFDLIFYEIFMDDVYLGFAHKFKAPVIAMSTSYMFPWFPDRFGIPTNPSYVPTLYFHTSNKMTFHERLYNSLLLVTGRLFYNYLLEPRPTNLMRKFFGVKTPPVSQLVKNISLCFTNTHFPLFGSRPYPPQVVDVSGLHLKPAKPLHQELDKWMNDSTEGVIYFSFGSMLRGATLPEDKVKCFLEVFETLPQRVLWKWEDDTIDRLPKNVKLMKWLPQRDILAHPNVKVFISHGGLLGTTEAVVSGVPILGIPMYGDQPNNVAALVENKVAIHVDYNNISVASLSYALKTLIHDKSYSQNAKELSRRFLDRPMSPLDTAIYWTEHVIRHKGAPHLQSAAVHLPWYQYYLLDVIGVLIAVLTVLLSFVYYTVKYCLRLVFQKKSTKVKIN